MPKRPCERIAASVRTKVRRSHTAARKNKHAAEQFAILRTDQKTVRSFFGGDRFFAEPDLHAAFFKGEAEQIRHSRRLPRSRINTPRFIRGKQPAERRQLTEQPLFAVSAEDCRDPVPAGSEITVSRKIFVRHIPLPVPRNGKLTPQTVVPLQKQNVADTSAPQDEGRTSFPPRRRR